MKRFSTLLLIVIGIKTISCSEHKTAQHYDFNQIENWDIALQNESRILPKVKGKLPEPEFSLQFINKKDSNCIKPILEFYAKEHQNTIERELMSYLVLRSSLYPAFHKIYLSEHHIVFGWNLQDNHNRQCCHCESLIVQLEKMYRLKEKPNL